MPGSPHHSLLAIFACTTFAGRSTAPRATDGDFGHFLDQIQATAEGVKLSDPDGVAAKLGCSVEEMNDPLRPTGAKVHDYVLRNCRAPVRQGEHTLYSTLGPDGKRDGGYIEFRFDTAKLPPKADAIALATRRFGNPDCKNQRSEGTLFTYCAFAPLPPRPVGIGLMYQESSLLIGLTLWGYDR